MFEHQQNTIPQPQRHKLNWFKCVYCESKFTHKGNLKQHVKFIHVLSSSKFQKCTFCEKTFHYKSGLQRHVDAVHLKIKTFTCQVCTKSFNRKGAYVKHTESNMHKNMVECQKSRAFQQSIQRRDQQDNENNVVMAQDSQMDDEKQ